jgi:hypothetical protein
VLESDLQFASWFFGRQYSGIAFAKSSVEIDPNEFFGAKVVVGVVVS